VCVYKDRGGGGGKGNEKCFVVCSCVVVVVVHFFFFFGGTGALPFSAQFFESGGGSRETTDTNKINQIKIRFEIHTFLLTRKIFSSHASPKHAHTKERKREGNTERETARARSRAAIKISTRENK
jgi:hypothetical protein